MVALERFGSPMLFLSGGHLPAAMPRGMDGAAPGLTVVLFLKRNLQDMGAQLNVAEMAECSDSVGISALWSEGTDRPGPVVHFSNLNPQLTLRSSIHISLS